MTSRRVPIAELPARRWAWLHIGLALVMLLCCMAVPGSTALAPANDAPQYRRGDPNPHLADELLAIEAKIEVEDEDETSNMEIVASALEFSRVTANFRVRTLERPIVAASGHLLVSTGLGRGPPVG